MDHPQPPHGHSDDQGWWRARLPESVPGADEVHVGRLIVSDAEGALAELESTLDEDEITRAGAFRSPADRTRYVSARGLARLMIGRYLDVAPDDIGFEVNAFGKPELTGSTAVPIHFNTSRSVDVILIAFATTPVGVDVEALRNDLPYHEMAQRFFSAAEIRGLDSVSPTDQLACFFELWARKEAYSKGIGEGLSIPPETYTVSIEVDRPAGVTSGTGDDHTGWSTMGLAVGSGYAGAVALAGSDWRIRTFDAALISG